MKYRITIFILFICLISFAQNKFLERNFWKIKPNIDTVKQLIKEGNSITEKNKHWMNGVCYAIIEGAPLETLKYIINTGVDVNELTHDKRNYIFWASYKNNFELMKFLLKKGSRTDLIDSAGYSLLQFTAVVGNSNPNIYNFILKNGGNIKEIDKKGRNIALLYAPRMKNLKMLDYFSEKGVDIHHKDKKGKGIFLYACKGKNKSILEGLIKKGIDYKIVTPNENAFILATVPMHRSTAKVDLELLNYLENLGLNPKFETENGTTALHNVAYSSKDSEVIMYFIKKGLDINKKTKKGNTPFMNAAYKNSKKILELLKPKNINQKNNLGETALIIAVRKNKPEIIEYLIQNGSNVDTKDNKQADLYHHLVNTYKGKDLKEFNEKVKILSKNGLDIKKSDGLLHFAINKGKTKIVSELINKKLNVNTKDKSKYTPLHIAVMRGKDMKLVKKLLSVGANKNTKTPMNETAYDLAKENEIFNKNKIDISVLK